jgi:hypothetical protein
MWYEICLLSIGIVCFGAFLLVVTISARDERKRKQTMHDKMRQVFTSVMKDRLPLVIACLLFSSTQVLAQPEHLGEFCWRLTPFDDVITVDVIQRTPPEVDFAMKVKWIGPLPGGTIAYTLQGNGSGGESYDENRVGFDFVMHNPSMGFFGNKRICRLTASLDMSTFGGPWFADCLSGTGGAAFVVQGTLAPVVCEGIGFFSQSQSESEPKLAGIARQ